MNAPSIFSPADRALIDKYLARQRVAENCSYCGATVEAADAEVHGDGDDLRHFCSRDHKRDWLKFNVRTDPNVLPILDLAAWGDGLAPEREWTLTDWIPLRQATYLTGPGSAGKSLLSQQLATCIALGLPFLGVETRQARALYVTCEDDPDELHRRQKAICEALGVSIAALAGRLLLVSLVGELGNELVSFGADGRLAPTDAYKRLERTAVDFGVGFVVLDNVAHLTEEEIARSKVAGFVNLLNRLAGEINGSVLFLGHPNKAGDNYSGSTAWENQVRSRLFLEIADEHDPDVRSLTRAKSNYARRGDQLNFRWHRWAFVRPEDLGDDMRRELEETARATADNSAFLACLRVRLEQRRPVSENKASRTYAPLEFAQMTEARGISKGRLEAAMDRLFRTQTIERGFLWREDGKDKSGLREKAADLPADLPRTVPADPLSVVTPTPAHTHPIPKGISGAALWAGAPDQEEDPAVDELLRGSL
jgi:RecA-family ATPase